MIVSTPKSIREFIRDARNASKSARRIAALLANDEREIAELRARIAENAETARQRQPSEARGRLLTQIVESAALSELTVNQFTSSNLFDLADQSESLAYDIERAAAESNEDTEELANGDNANFAVKFAYARKSGAESLLENDAVIELLRATLAALRCR